MIKNKNKILLIALTTLSIISISFNVYAHSGRTDSSGGHKDNKNKSGLGSYHYHCGGYPAHLHENGVCPYTSNKSTTTSSPILEEGPITQNKEVYATGIQINQNIEEMEVGETQKLNVTLEPSDVTEKEITWQSNDQSIATVSETGEVVAKGPGKVDITASTSNGKTCTIQINVKEIPAVVAVSSSINNTTDNSAIDDQEDSNPMGTILTLGLIGGGYWGYKKYKK